MEEAVSERCKAFAAAHRSDEDRQAYISASRCALSVIAKAKAKAWQATCSSFSPKSNSKSVYSLLRSVAGSSSSSPNFPNCSSPRESASVFADYLRSHFSFSQPKALRSRAIGYLSELRRATCPEGSRLSFCSLFSLAEFLAAASNLYSSTATGSDKAAYPMQSIFLALAWIFFFTSLIFPGFRIPFLPSGRHLPLFASTRWEGLSTLLLPSGLSFSPPAYQSWHPAFSINYFFFILLASLLALVIGLNFSFLICALVWFIKITKVVPFESVEVCCKDLFLAQYFSLSSSMIFLFLCLLPSAALFTLTFWPFGPPPPRSLLRLRPHKELCFDCSAGLSTGVFLSIRANVRPPSSQWIPTRPTSSYSTHAFVSIPLKPFMGSPSTAHFPFLNMYLR